MASSPPTISLALQGGGSHGAFTWGVLDRLLQEVTANRLRIAAISGSSAGAINAALTVSGLVQGGPDIARQKLTDFWHTLSRRGFLAGNPLIYCEPGPFGGVNLDWSPITIAMEAIGLVVSPYTNPFYADALAPLLAQAFPAADVAALNAAIAPRLFVGATDVVSNGRAIFTQPDISIDTLRASACLPTEFKAVATAGRPTGTGSSPIRARAAAGSRAGSDAGPGERVPPRRHAATLCPRQSWTRSTGSPSTPLSCWRSMRSRRSTASSPSWRHRA